MSFWRSRPDLCRVLNVIFHDGWLNEAFSEILKNEVKEAKSAAERRARNSKLIEEIESK